MTRQNLPGLACKAGHDPRAAALRAIHAVLRGDENSQSALSRGLDSGEMSPTDRRLCTELAYGVLRAYGSLRDEVFALLDNPDKLPPEMRLTLILSCYELGRLRVPPHATVHWAVTHIRNRFGRDLAGVANAVLRSLARRRGAGEDPPPPSGSPLPPGAGDEEALARRHALPSWIVRLWREQYGQEALLRYLAASSGRPPSGLRLNRRFPDWVDTLRGLQAQGPPEARPLRVGEAALAFPGSLPVQAGRLLAEGRASRQSAASYQALLSLEPSSWPGPLWDACAGRGGKTMALLEVGLPVALATDPAGRRLRALAPEYRRLVPAPPLPRLLPLAAQEAPGGAAAPGGSSASLPSRFGAVLLDVPCSGLGTLARHPEIRLRLTAERISRLAALQRALLEAAWDRLLPGGRVIYLTCTLNKAENEDQIAAFLSRHASATLIREFQTPSDSPLLEFFYAACLGRSDAATGG
ncbi:MAG: Fmu (Sun) domain-containing protein [Desulfovibrio sp.]|jgi:16S rRNA (cytosine967-C5)-methyltransferase|nr:Fmu (Sun) domain-containing protein [Desulfovibrio sp.]